MIDHRENEKRWVDRRTSYLKRATALDETDAEIITHSELGYSSSGIAKQIDLGESTVRAHLEEIADTHGPQACWARRADELAIEAGLDPQDSQEVGAHV